jgi:restriction endonuclease S subunit
MCRTNGTLLYVGMSALVLEDMGGLIFPDKVMRVRASEAVAPAYLSQILKIPHLRMQIEAAARTAVGNYAIGSSDVWNLQLPLPPLDVQRRIMAHVADARQRAAQEQQTANALASRIADDMEAYLLGTKKVAKG